MDSEKLSDQFNVTQLRTAGNWTRIFMDSSNQIHCYSFFQIVPPEFLYKYLHHPCMIRNVCETGFKSSSEYPLLNMETLYTKIHVFNLVATISVGRVYIFSLNRNIGGFASNAHFYKVL